jgi:nucleoid DNA-binding protein
MTLRELANLVSEQLTAEGQGEFINKQTYRVLKRFLKDVETCLAEGEVVRLENFGSFKSERTTGSGRLPGRPRSTKYGIFFKPFQDMRRRVRSNRLRPQNPYSLVLRSDPMSLARLTGRCPTCGLILPVVLPLRCTTCGATPFERKS